MLIPVTYFRGFDLADRTIGQPHRDSRVSGKQSLQGQSIVGGVDAKPLGGLYQTYNDAATTQKLITFTRTSI